MAWHCAGKAIILHYVKFAGGRMSFFYRAGERVGVIARGTPVRQGGHACPPTRTEGGGLVGRRGVVEREG